jgi:type IV secretion system protein VirB6
LLAIGPLFILFWLFEATRGLFAGWVRASVRFALAPAFAIILASFFMAVLEPTIARAAALRAAGQTVDGATATTVLLMALVFAAVVLFTLKTASQIADGFSLPAPAAEPQATSASQTIPREPASGGRVGEIVAALRVRDAQITAGRAGGVTANTGGQGSPGALGGRRDAAPPPARNLAAASGPPPARRIGTAGRREAIRPATTLPVDSFGGLA